MAIKVFKDGIQPDKEQRVIPAQVGLKVEIKTQGKMNINELIRS